MNVKILYRVFFLAILGVPSLINAQVDVVNKGVPITIVEGSVHINGNYIHRKDSLTNLVNASISNGDSLFINGNIFNEASNSLFITDTGVVILNGNQNQSFFGDSLINFRNLVLNKSAGDLVLQRPLKLSAALHFINGKLAIGSHDILLGTTGFINNETENHRIYNGTGTVRANRFLNAGLSGNNLAGMGLTLNYSGSMGLVDIRRSFIVQQNVTNQSIAKHFELERSVASPIAFTGGNMRFFNAELNGQTKDSLQLWVSNNEGVQWFPLAGSIDTTNNIFNASSGNTLNKTLFTLAERDCHNPPQPQLPDTLYQCGSETLLLDPQVPGFLYAWSNGDSNHTTSVSNAGIYYVTITSLTGCRAIDTVQILQKPNPVAAFASSNLCLGNTSSFTNNTTITSTNITSYMWDFGVTTNPNAIDSVFQPSYTYASPGVYQVQLRVETEFGCVDSVQNQVIIFPNPQVGFQFNNSCSDSLVQFTNTSTIQSGGMLYQWNFGNGQTSTASNPAHTFTTDGTFQVKLIATSNAGCQDSLTQSIQIQPNPNAAITANDICALLPVPLSNSTTVSSGSVQYHWNFGDGTSDTVQLPTKTYSTGGIYTILLTATSSNGCTDTSSAVVNITSSPFAQFSSADVCDGNTVVFTNNSTTVATTTYAWNLGNGQTSTNTNESMLYANSGVYTVSLIAASTNGCSDTATTAITVHPIPTASFTVGNLCANNNLAFNNTSSVAFGNINYAWDFGDGTTDTLSVPTKSYNLATNYTVQLIASNSFGCADTAQQAIIVRPLPVVQLQDTALCGNTFTLNALNAGANFAWSSGGSSQFETVNASGIYSVTVTNAFNCSKSDTANISLNPLPNVNLGPDTTVCGSYTLQTGLVGTHLWSTNSTNASITVSNSGTYYVKLTDINGCEGFDTISLNILQAPNLALGSPILLCDGDSAILSAGTSAASYLWNTGDTTQSIVVNTTGVYSISASMGSGCVSSDSIQVTFSPVPQANFSFSNVCEGNTVNFTNTSVVGGQVNYFWKFGNGSSSTFANPSMLYSNSGNYSVELIATTAAGCSDTLSQTINVYPQPTASFSVSDVCLGNTSVFSNTSSIASGNLNSTWTWQSAIQDTATNTSNLFASAGTYPIKLRVESDFGCLDSSVVNHVVHALPQFTLPDSVEVCANSTQLQGPMGNFAYNWSNGANTAINTVSASGWYFLTVSNAASCQWVDSSYVALNSPMNFSLGSPIQSCGATQITAPISGVNYAWSTGDTTQQINALQSGVYSLTLTDANNCSAVDSVSVTITAQPTVNLGANDTLCAGSSKVLNSGNPLALRTWSNGSTNQAIQVTQSGMYSVTVNDNGCVSSDSVFVHFSPAPSVDFSHSGVCLNDTLVFSNLSSIASGSLSYMWNFGDNTSSTAQHPQHVYANAGTYTVSLTATSNTGCVATKSSTVVVRPMPLAAFVANDVCANSNLNLFNTSSIPQGSFTSLWDFGGIIPNSTQTNPVVSFSNAGVIPIQLTVTSAFGCASTFTDSVEIFALPSVSLGGNISTCANSFVLNAQQTGTATYLWSNNSNNATLTVTQNGNYAVTVSNANGCSASDVVNVQLSSPVLVNLGADTSVCDSVFITAGNPGATYSWNNAAITQGFWVNTTGSYEVTVTDQNNCVGSDTIQITVNASPTVSIGPDTAYCESLGAYSIQASGSHTSYLWSNGSTSNNVSVIASGVYSLTVSNAIGCLASDTMTLTLYPQPNVAYAVQNTCASNQAVFSNSSSITTGNLSYLWQFGDGSNSNQVNPSHSYNAGSYTSQLIATSNQGCADSLALPLVVHPEPQAQFTLPLLCGANQFTVNNSSSIASGNVSYLWDFGNGQSDTAYAPTINYATPGTYTVKLIVTSDSACVDSTSLIAQVNAVPQANLPATVSLCDTSYTLNAGNAGATFAWSTGQSSQNIQLNTSGTYVVTITNASGCSIIDSTQLTLNTPVSISMASPQTACDSLLLDAGNAGANFVWSNGANTQTTSVTSSGMYSVTVTNAQACSASANVLVSINASPVVNLGPDTTLCASSPYTLNAGNNGSSYVWSTSQSSQQISVSTPGSYSVTVSTAQGCISIDSVQVNHFAVPTAAFVASDFCVNTGVQFTNTSSIAQGTMSYLWNFGNGQTSTAQSPLHSYSNAGTYSVNVLVTSNNGCTHSNTQTIQVRPAPTVQFNVSNACELNNLNLVNTSTISSGNLSYNWNFGDATTSTVNNPQKSYSAAGVYSLQLIATSNFGCVDSSAVPVTIHPLPVLTMPDTINSCNASETLNAGNPGSTYIWSNLSFTQSINVQNTGNYRVTVTSPNACVADTVVRVNFNNLFSSNMPATATACDSTTLDAGNIGSTYLWSTGDTTRTINAIASANYSVQITDANGCVSFDTTQVLINPSPVVNLGVDTSYCANFSLTLDAGFPGSNYQWSNGANTQTQNITTSGNYFVTVSDANGCFGIDNLLITVHPLPIFNLGADTLICDSMPLLISANAANYVWSSGQNTQQIVVSQSGTYWAQATSNQGCVFSDTINITVQPAIAFSLGADTTLCSGTSLLLGPGVSAASYAWRYGSSDSSLLISNSGLYWLSITSANGCVTTDTIQVNIQQGPQPDLGSDKVLCFGQEVTLNAGSGFSFAWFADSGQFADTVILDSNAFRVNTSSSSLLVQDSGFYWLEVIDSLGCKGSDSVHINILDGMINARFLAASEALVGDTVQFISISTPDSLPHKWEFGDGVISQLFDPQHTYFIADSFTVSLVVSSGFCSDSTSKYILIANPKTDPGTIPTDSLEQYFNAFEYVKVYPNPVRTQTTLEYELRVDGLVHIELFDMNGSFLQTMQKQGVKNQVPIQMENRATGMYIIRVRVGNQQKTLKIIKL